MEEERLPDAIDFAGPAGALAFEQVKESIDLQMGTGEHLDRKGLALFTIASGLIGIAVPIVLAQLLGDTAKSWPEWLAWTLSIPVAIYLASACCFVKAYKLSTYEQVRNPREIRKILNANEHEARAMLWGAFDRAFRTNTGINDSKADWVQWLLYSVIAQTLVTTVYLGLFITAAFRG